MHFDYIVIGAGSAGCVLAHRLSADPAVTVLLLEAGGTDSRREIHVPVAALLLQKSEVDWAYTTEPQEHLNGRRLFWPRGKVLGGSSSINTMLHVRGHRGDYDEWRDMGNIGWSYQDVLPFFKKMEHYAHSASEHYGAGGPLHVEKGAYVNPLWEVFVDVAAKRGIAINHDSNGQQQDGAGIFDRTVKGGKRQSTAVAYLKPALQRRNLHVETHALVRRILFEGTRAVGVELAHGTELRQARAHREVILSAGAIGSPQILMLSGVGPAGHLGEHGIPVVADVPGVGQNLRDHTVFSVAYLCPQKITINSAFTPLRVLEYLLLKRGPLTIFPIGAYAYVKMEPDADRPDMQINMVSGWAPDVSENPEPPKEDGFTLAPITLRPRSVGALTLRSREPGAPPVLQPNVLADEYDMRLAIAGYRMCQEMMQDELFAPYRTRIVTPERELHDDDEIWSYIIRATKTAYHPIGTCKMGVDSMAVVDPSLRVRGVQGLRVVDASIMPTMISGNTNAPTIMIAEKAAELILQNAD